MLLMTMALGQEDCEALPTIQQLKSRPWFCEPPGARTETDDLSACRGEGHRLNRTQTGLCRGRWQWYQVSTVHDVVEPYYEITSLEDGKMQHVRGEKVRAGMRHALAFSLQTEFCPHTPDCGTAGQPQAYYTTVDVLVVDGELRHSWDTTAPFPGVGDIQSGIDGYYSGDRYGRMFRYYKRRKSLALTFGFHTNHTEGCDVAVSDKVNIGVYCSWTPQGGVELDTKQCLFSLTAHLIPEQVYDGFDATYPIAPAGDKGFDDLTPQYMRDELGVSKQKDPASHYFRVHLDSFDVLNVTISRAGPNLTFYDAEGKLLSNGHGLRGTVVRRRVTDGCPTNQLQDQAANVTEFTTSVEMPAFCTDTEDAGEYRIAILAAEEFGPFYANLPDQSDGKVAPDGQPSTFYSPRHEQTA